MKETSPIQQMVTQRNILDEVAPVEYKPVLPPRFEKIETWKLANGVKCTAFFGKDMQLIKAIYE